MGSAGSVATAVAADEESLVRGAQAGDRRSFEQWITLHSVWIYSTAWHIAGAADAADLYQEIVLHVMENLSAFSGKSKSGTWLRTVFRNFSLNWVRAKKKRATVAVDDEVLESAASLAPGAVADDPAVLFESVERERILREALSQLGENAQRAVTMRYFLEMNYKDIALCLQSTPDAARMLVNRSIQTLAKNVKLQEALSDE